MICVDCRKDAIRNTIAAMTLGKDVSALFPDIIKNMVGYLYGCFSDARNFIGRVGR